LEGHTSDLLNGRVIHTDETPVRTTQRLDDAAQEPETSVHTTFNAYVRVYSNSTTTVLSANAHKDDAGIKQDGILGRFCGILSHDHDAKLYKYGNGHATCCEHLCRELKGMDELCRVDWAGVVRRFFQNMNRRKKEDIAAGVTACAPPDLADYEKTYDDLVTKGETLLRTKRKKELGYDELRKMIARLKAYKNSYLRFIRNYAAPFTNNQAERDLRHVKIRQKVAGCYRSWYGLVHYCKIRSMTGTAKKRGLNSLAAIYACLPAFLPR
jgi:transposase